MWLSFIVVAAFAAEEPIRPDLPPEAWPIGLDASGDRLVLATSDGAARVFTWDGAPVATFDVGRYNPEVDLGDGGRTLLTRDDRGVVRIFDVDSGKVIATHRPASRWATITGAMAEDERRWLLAEDYVVRLHDGSGSTYLGDGWGDPRTMGARGGQLWIPANDGLRVGPASAWERGPTVPLPESPQRVRSRGDRLWVGTYGAGLHVIDPATGSARPVPVPGFPVGGAFDVSSDGRRVVYAVDGAGYGVIVAVWDVAEGRRAGAIDLGDAYVNEIELSPDGRRIAVIADSRLEIHPVPGPSTDADAAVLGVGFLDGDGAAWALYADGRARTWAADGALATEAWLPLSSDAVFDVRDGAVVWGDAAGRLWRASLVDGEASTAGNAGGAISALATAADGTVAVQADGRLRTWAPDGTPVLDREHYGWVEALAVEPGGRRVVTAKERTIGLLDADGVAWSAPYDGEVLDLVLGDEVIALTSTKDRVRIGLDGKASTSWIGDGGAWYHADLHEDGTVLAGDEYEGLWLVRDRPEAYLARQRPLTVDLSTQAVALAPGERFALVASDSGLERIRVDGEIVMLTGSPAAFGVDVAGDRVVSVTSDTRLRIGEQEVRLPSEAYAVAVSPDGRTVAVGRADGTVSLHAPDGGEPDEIAIAEAPITRLAWSPNGRGLVAQDDDGNVHVFAAQPGASSVAFAGDGAAWAPDGRLVVVDFLFGLAVDANGEWRPNPKARRRQRDLNGAIAPCGDGSFVLTSWLGRKGGLYLLPEPEGRLQRVRVPEVGTVAVCDGSTVVAHDWTGAITIVDLEAEAIVERIPGDGRAVFDVARLPDGRLVVAGPSGVEVR